MQRERDAWKPPIVSSKDAERVCIVLPPKFHPYCGRRKRANVTLEISKATCADCLTAMRADGIKTP